MAIYTARIRCRILLRREEQELLQPRRQQVIKAYISHEMET